MATEADRQEERERLGIDPLRTRKPGDGDPEARDSLENTVPLRGAEPHAIEEELEGAGEHQSASDEQEPEDEEPATYEDGQPIDVELLEAQRQKPGFQASETMVRDPSRARYTISGRDEESDEPGAVPPGESM
jgi:hypothetical protein